MNVGVVGNPRYEALELLLARLAHWAPAHQLELFAEADLQHLWPSPVSSLDSNVAQLDLLLTFGGDGTLLRGARLLGRHDAPILGVNLGRVGFLTTATAATLDDALDAVVRGAYDVESRRTLEARIFDQDGAERAVEPALNDVVVRKAGAARVISVRLTVDEEEVGRYSADGIIVATPAGSTAYSLSAGGPVVVPGVDALVITAICPHTLAVRPIVVRGTSRVALDLVPPGIEDVLISCDGQISTVLEPGHRVVVERSAHAVRLIRLGREGFFARMRRKLQWGDLSDRERSARAE